MHVVNKNVERVKKWRIANPERRREYARKDQERRRSTPEGRAHLYAIATKSRHKKYLKGELPPYRCPEFCEICSNKKRLCLDHDHRNGKFRGWLCASCNRGLGLLGDNEFRLANALRYLRGDKTLLGTV